jgi:AcrR family transcriptional regulator
MKPVNTQPSRLRGRPRNTASREAVLMAAADLIETEGLGAVTMEAVARLTGVGKPTLYRSWRNREELAMAALLHGGRPKTSVKETRTVTHDLARHISKVIATFSNPKGRNAALMVASADPDSELAKAFRNQVMLKSREEGRHLITRGIDDGMFRPDINVETVLDLIYGPIFYRLLIGHQPINDAFGKALLHEIMDGISRAAKVHPLPEDKY